MATPPQPHLAKAHNEPIAELYVRLGWELRQVFEDSEGRPYEWLLEWIQDSEPVSPTDEQRKHAGS